MVWRPDLFIVNKKEKLPNSGLAVSTNHMIKVKESKKWEKYPNLARQTMDHASDSV